MSHPYEHFVEFDRYCYRCQYATITEDARPCCDCISTPLNYGTHKPVYFKELKEKKK